MMDQDALEATLNHLNRLHLQAPDWADDGLRAAVTRWNDGLAETAGLYGKLAEWQAKRTNPATPVSELAKSAGMVDAYMAKAQATEQQALQRIADVAEAMSAPVRAQSERARRETDRIAAHVGAELRKLGFDAGAADRMATESQLTKAAWAQVLYTDAWQQEVNDRRRMV